jgi:subtilisin family serine protease
MNKKLLLVLLLVVVLCLSLAVVGCKSADTPQEQTPQDGGEVIENPNEGENDPPSGEVEYYEDRVLVVLEHQASIDSLALDSLLDLYWGEEVVEVKPRYLYRDEVVKRRIANGELEDQKVVDYQRSLYLFFDQPNEETVERLINALPLRDDVMSCELVPIIVPHALSVSDARYNSTEHRVFTLQDMFEDNCVLVMLTREASVAYYLGAEIDWGFEYIDLLVTGANEKLLAEEDRCISLIFTLAVHDKQYVLDVVDALMQLPSVSDASPSAIMEIKTSASANDYYYDHTLLDYTLQSDIYQIINLQDAWDITTGSSDIKVGLADTDIDCKNS